MYRFLCFFALYCLYTFSFLYVLLYITDSPASQIPLYSLIGMSYCLPYFLCGYAINNVRFAEKGRIVLDVALIGVTPLILVLFVLVRGSLAMIILSYVVFAAFWIALAHFFPIQSWTKG